MAHETNDLKNYKVILGGFIYPFQLKKPIYDEAFLRKNCDGECRLYQVIQPNSPSKFLPKRRSQKLASSAGMGIDPETSSG
ncbi:MAG: hypothetical protein A2887_05275 [Alphaproteobacteria bacterium RIFCSPLOWO2_01_FULL_40_26]|nr:MAG: hypothetical protein A3D15_05250 [Alphaproteobacteria bacterium RIFCSPHIGHO2_02_FULL_40_34]OFW94744.1 MAG: hypothetical protein A2887_05275 [Alphaproteobacteria bacterium RIFCSPLOWO2_01_FULL_40_26]OFX10377.1 MAG: hypothetical protein A3H30_01510 [Alphaproteobacteria bacterium RIFCSPLOWO2_02_FULL_40_19]OFX12045.1 MAG: hypothetical protein A3G22_03395 [Alphaproteobacteria bacterium RIFCSPLOWO2_12_FULL_40_11]